MKVSNENNKTREYEWAFVEYDDSDKRDASSCHASTLNELFGQDKLDVNKIETDEHYLELKCWYWSEKHGEWNVDYASISNGTGKINEASHFYGKKIPKRFQKELDRFIGE